MGFSYAELTFLLRRNDKGMFLVIFKKNSSSLKNNNSAFFFVKCGFSDANLSC